MGRKQNRRELRAALETGEVVTLTRNVWKADHLEGYVVGVGADWVLLHVVHDVELNGWSAVRLDTVGRVSRQSNDGFLNRALEWYGQVPYLVRDVDLSSRDTVIRDLAEDHPLLTVFTECIDPTVCAIGRPQRITKKRLHLLDISSEAVWYDDPRRVRLDDLTRIDVGGRYETALHHLGGYPPIP